MEVSIFSDDQLAAERLRCALSDCEIHCPIDHIRSIASADSVSLSGVENLDIVFVIVLEGDAGLALLERLTATVSIPVVAVGAARDPQFMLRVIQTRPSDYLDIDGDLSTDLQRALTRAESRRPAVTASGRLISVFSHCGGSGCSFLATNLAVALSELHKGCLLCDFNVRRGDLAALLNLKPQFSINDITKNLAKLEQGLFDQVLTPHPCGVQLLAAPSSLTDVHPIPVETVSRILGMARARFPFTVADLEDFFHAEQFELLRQSETILFILHLDYTSLRNARRTFEYLERDSIEPGRIRLVVNQYGRPRELTVGQAEDVLGRKPDYYVPFDPKPAITSVNRGEPLLLTYPKSKTARMIREIAVAVARAETAVALT